MTFDLLLKNFNIGHNLFVLRGRAYIFRAPPLGGCPIVITLSVCPSVCPSANFNIDYNFFTVRDRAFIFGISVPYDKTLPTVP